ncbi:MAG: transposase [Wenzhouxiangellaceae bacterium]|nr:transposase [Wenzhouxiangellaceae bacterium]
MRYRRTYIAGATWFFTVVVAGRQPIFRNPAAVDLLRKAFRHVRMSRPFEIDAICVLPDHLHCLWTLPLDDTDYSTRWRLIKTRFTKTRAFMNARSVWQKRYREHVIRDDDDLRNHVDYIHYNPVKHGLVERPADWKYSSFSKWLDRGHYTPDWGSTPVGFGDDVGNE